MNVIRGRPLLTGLVVAGLLLGGCGEKRHPVSPAPDRPAAVTADDEDVNGLLDEVDEQLDADDQPAEDQD